MQIDQMKELYDYDHWANERLWQTVAGLNVDQLSMEMHNGIGSILTTLLHMVNGVWFWRTRWQGDMLLRHLFVEDFPTLQSIRTRWQEEGEQIQCFLATLHDEDLERELRYISPIASRQSNHPASLENTVPSYQSSDPAS